MEETELNHHNKSLEDFLALKPLYYSKIDITRMPRIYNKIKKQLKYGEIIHIIGTNAKGTTGRFLATALYNKGYKVGHYSSPHILKFNERIWINGNDATDKELEDAHLRLLFMLKDEDAQVLSYFEYTTLLSILVFKNCDYIILEAGLGGEHDATAVFDKKLTLVTPIDFDHQDLLGNSINSIATTKLNIMSNTTIVGYQKHLEVYDIAREISYKNNNILIYLKDIDKIPTSLEIAKKLNINNYLKDNLMLAISAIHELGFKITIDDFKNAFLFGRASKIAPNIYLDVGHNELAARAILDIFKNKKIILIYNSYQDKNYTQILSILKPIISSVKILEIDDKRVISTDILMKSLKKLKIQYDIFSHIKPDEDYLVFGSFLVANRFLKHYKESN